MHWGVAGRSWHDRPWACVVPCLVMGRANNQSNNDVLFPGPTMPCSQPKPLNQSHPACLRAKTLAPKALTGKNKVQHCSCFHQDPQESHSSRQHVLSSQQPSMADQQHQPTGGQQQAPGPMSLQQLQAANYYASMPLESPLFLPILPVRPGRRSNTRAWTWTGLDCGSCTAPPHAPQVEPSPTTGIQHLIPPLFQGNAPRQVVGGGRDAGIGPAQLPSPVRGCLGVQGLPGIRAHLEQCLGAASRAGRGLGKAHWASLQPAASTASACSACRACRGLLGASACPSRPSPAV